MLAMIGRWMLSQRPQTLVEAMRAERHAPYHTCKCIRTAFVPFLPFIAWRTDRVHAMLTCMHEAGLCPEGD